LCAAIKTVINSAGIGNAGEAKFFSVGRTHHGGRERLRTGLRGKRLRQERATHEKEKKEKVFHFGLDARILTAGWNELKSVEATVVKRKVYHYR
jgi:hypothetical protein